MKRTTAGRIAIYIVLLCLFGMAAQSCNSERKCGCGPDLNNSWKPKRHRY